MPWSSGSGVAIVLNDTGKPWQNGTDESFKRKFRDEYLSIEWLRSRREAAVLIEAWRNHYNEVRPRNSLQYLTPSEFKQELGLDPQPAVFEEELSRLNRAGHQACVAHMPINKFVHNIRAAHLPSTLSAKPSERTDLDGLSRPVGCQQGANGVFDEVLHRA